MEIKTKSRVPAVPALPQHRHFDAASRRLVGTTSILDNFVPPKHTGPERKPLAVQKNKAVEALAEKYALWSDIAASAGSYFNDDGEERYLLFAKLIKGLQVPSGAVEALVPRLEQLGSIEPHSGNSVFYSGAGIFLSVLMNKSTQQDFTLLTNLWETDTPELIGMRNHKNITIHGSVGFGLGAEMSGGRIVVHGDAGGSIGASSLGYRMTGGQIVVYGDVSDDCGYEMNGGIIEIHGNLSAGPLSHNFGYMEKGTITVHGHIHGGSELWSELGEANLYQVLNGRKRQLVKNGKPINEPRD